MSFIENITKTILLFLCGSHIYQYHVQCNPQSFDSVSATNHSFSRTIMKAWCKVWTRQWSCIPFDPFLSSVSLLQESSNLWNFKQWLVLAPKHPAFTISFLLRQYLSISGRAAIRNKQRWRAPLKNRTSRYISFVRPSLNGVLFPMFCLLVEGECQILVF